MDSGHTINSEVCIRLSAKLEAFSNMCCGGVNNPYFVISRANNINKKDDWLKVFKSPQMNNTASPTWNPVKIKLE
jgi:hypothetical protein